jgi:hypothetical protein
MSHGPRELHAGGTLFLVQILKLAPDTGQITRGGPGRLLRWRGVSGGEPAQGFDAGEEGIFATSDTAE